MQNSWFRKLSMVFFYLSDICVVMVFTCVNVLYLFISINVVKKIKLSLKHFHSNI